MADETAHTSKKAKVTYEQYEGPQKAMLVQNMPLYTDFVTVLPSGTRMPGMYRQYHDQYQNFKGRTTDIWVSSYPKAGTTWTQEMVWCLLFKLTSPRITDVLTKRFPFFEWDSLFNEGCFLDHVPEGNVTKIGTMWEILHTSLPDPRTIKTHLHRDLLPIAVDTQKPKVLYVCRDPRDVCVSLFYQSVKLDGFQGTFNDFVKLFLEGALPWSPFWSHVLSSWRIRDQPNVLFLTYEQLKKDLRSCLKQVSTFLGVTREGLGVGELSMKEIEELEDHLSFSSMSRNPAVNYEMLDSAAVCSDAKKTKFMRKGMVGDHKTHLTAEHLQQFKKWTEDALQGSDFPYYKDYEK